MKDLDPLEIALREVADTNRLIDALLTSSEAFDYMRSKATLGELEIKITVLGRMSAQLVQQAATEPNPTAHFPSWSAT